MRSRVEWPGWFSLSLPPSWEYEDSGDAISIYDPAGVGAMTLSAAHRPNQNEPTATDAADVVFHFAKARGWDVRPDQIEARVVDSVPIAHASCQQGEDTWDLWSILDRDRAVTMTYVSSAADNDVERARREEIVQSFTWLAPTTRQ